MSMVWMDKKSRSLHVVALSVPHMERGVEIIGLGDFGVNVSFLQLESIERSSISDEHKSLNLF